MDRIILCLLKKILKVSYRIKFKISRITFLVSKIDPFLLSTNILICAFFYSRYVSLINYILKFFLLNTNLSQAHPFCLGFINLILQKRISIFFSHSIVWILLLEISLLYSHRYQTAILFLIILLELDSCFNWWFCFQLESELLDDRNDPLLFFYLEYLVYLQECRRHEIYIFLIAELNLMAITQIGQDIFVMYKYLFLKFEHIIFICEIEGVLKTILALPCFLMSVFLKKIRLKEQQRTCYKKSSNFPGRTGKAIEISQII